MTNYHDVIKNNCQLQVSANTRNNIIIIFITFYKKTLQTLPIKNIFTQVGITTDVLNTLILDYFSCPRKKQNPIYLNISKPKLLGCIGFV